MTECTCEWHGDYKLLLSLKDKLDEHTFSAVHRMVENLWSESEDREYYKAILHGDWPQSVEILTKALDRAKERALNGNH
jgi:hypothetical protein